MSLLTSFVNDNASDQFGFVETYNGHDGSFAATNLTADSVYLTRVRVKAAITVSTMHVYIGAALGNVDLGIYTGTRTGTLTRIASTGSTAAAGSSALQSIALTASVTLTPGTDYWFAFGSTSGSTTLTVARSASVIDLVLVTDALAKTAIKAAAWSSGLPTTIASLSATSNVVWVAAS